MAKAFKTPNIKNNKYIIFLAIHIYWIKIDKTSD